PDASAQAQRSRRPAERLSLSAGRLLRWACALASGPALVGCGLAIGVQVRLGGQTVDLGSSAAVLSALWMSAVTLLILLANRGEGLVSGVGTLSGLALLAAGLLVADASEAASAARHLCLILVGGLAPYTLAALVVPEFRFGGGASLAVGAWLAAVTVLGALKGPGFVFLVIPLVVLGAPVAGTLLAYAAGRARGARGIRPDREWPSFLELFVRRGMNPPRAVAFLLCWHAYLCSAGLTVAWLRHLPPWVQALLAAAVALAGLFLFYVGFQVVCGGKRELAPHVGGRDRVCILGVWVDRLDVPTTLSRIERFIAEGGPHLIVTLDAGGVLRAREDEEFGRIVADAALVTPDGAGVVLAARLLDEPFHHRVSGCDLVYHICEMAAAKGFSVFLFGAKPGVADEAAARLATRYPGLRVAGTAHGYFDRAKEDELVTSIAAARPHVLFVAMGLPAQEKWIARHAEKLGVPVCIGVGGSFDVIAGHVQRAPEWVRRCWGEFLWRIGHDPKRVGRLLAIARFFWQFLLEAPAALRKRRLHGS
ncbi:MAG TPA: WecB/TagA/CpsF family glycosyltransferase, partial [Armatimonadota bacterium]|nr:WecB/TagA/CpsF family glycosyltransferase [Armatimonadota bacterium]